MKWVCQSLGLSKQAYYQQIKRDKARDLQRDKIIEWVIEYRKILPKTGTRKLFEYLQPKMQEINIKMGRDALNDLLRSRGMLIKKTKRYFITTDSKHFFHKSPNLLTDLKITHSEQVFVTDITYIKTDAGHSYLALVTDAYSRKIMGWSLQDNMKVSMVKDALNMAYKNRVFNHKNIIHHSDRGIQYCCPDYSQYAENKGFILSTTQQYDPYENAIVERINGILKYEFGLRNTIKSVDIAQKMVTQAVDLYNNLRMHWSLDFKKPQEVNLQYNKQENKNYKKEKKVA
ncbi:IS3 family transposase [Flavobacterium psychrophilum]|uniref:IS3 family transposase n=1 Tax=Flavobacterium psychrophilum TaxID=96345 RepID=UPI001EE20AA9|nr:IS3 family transposase [Flavobacterium psychrophilum]